MQDDEWTAALSALAVCCEGGREPADTLIERLAALLACGPVRVTAAMGITYHNDAIARLIEAQALESAVIALAGSHTGFLVSRAPDGTSIASAWIPDMIEETTVSTGHPATALCGAIAQACADAALAWSSGPRRALN